jgi:protein O-mannosyl-transferase
VLGDKELGKRMTEQAVQVDPKEPAYRITLIRMLVALDQAQQARAQLQQLGKLNIAGRLNDDMTVLKQLTNDAR